jgi:hypothetical protein
MDCIFEITVAGQGESSFKTFLGFSLPRKSELHPHAFLQLLKA